jgi:hypothetical protein
MTTRRSFFKLLGGVGALFGASVSGQTRTAALPVATFGNLQAPDVPTLNPCPPVGSCEWQRWQDELMQQRATIAGQKARIALLEAQVQKQRSALDGNYL